LARSTRDTLDIAERLERAGADLVSLSESIDTTSAAGRMVFRMLAVLAEFERDLVGERTRCAMHAKRAKGERTSGHLPFGFSLAADGVHLVESAHEQVILARILELRREGLSLRAIAAELVRLGMKPRSGATWSPKVLRDICAREASA
jgi:DNA invertase Pin-like site-specific DNA recombinase